ncbi:MAG: phosphohydrolase, partial [Bradyrhizobium sp.]
LEDTDSTQEELALRFGSRVTGLVEEVTDDMALSKDERRRLQVIEAPKKSMGAKLIKIADKISNVRARVFFEPSLLQRVELMDYVAWAEQVVAGCRGGNVWLDRTFDEAVTKARGTL